MSFAKTLNSYCTELGRVNKDIAAACNVSASALSRYRSGQRMPKSGSATIANLANGIARLSRADGIRGSLQADSVQAALEASLVGEKPAGPSFNARLDRLMSKFSIKNVSMAAMAGVDPSYISRIRKGERMPSNQKEFSETCARRIARTCLEQNRIEDLLKIIGPSSNLENTIGPDEAERPGEFVIDEESNLIEIIQLWLMGDLITNSDIVKMDTSIKWLDQADLSKWVSLRQDDERSVQACPARLARFYYGLAGMRAAELDFFEITLETHAHTITLSSDEPLLQMRLDDEFRKKYKHAIVELLKAGCHVNIIHNVERPLDDILEVLKLWIPFYATGQVTPYFLSGVNNRLFFHVNYVSPVCALASEAVIGHQEDGRYYLTTRPEDLTYYQKKIKFILEKTASMFDIYRDCNPEQKAAFAQVEKGYRYLGTGRPIGRDRYQNMTIDFYPGKCVIMTIPCKPAAIHFVIRHPKVRYAVSLLE